MASPSKLFSKINEFHSLFGLHVLCSSHISIYLKSIFKYKTKRIRNYGFDCFAKDIFDCSKEMIPNQTFEWIHSLFKTAQSL